MASQLNVPLLEQEVCTRKRPQYLNVNFLNHWFLIWAGKIIDVIFFDLFSIFRKGIDRPSSKICTTTSGNLRKQGIIF
jgi:hypothetical protein